jgi:CTP:molybdopterin cytidylyltransferase MocA
VIDAAIVLAAGRGTRLGAPKVLLSVGGVPLVAQHRQRLRALPCARIVFVVPRALASSAATLVDDADALIVGVRTRSQAESLERGLDALGPALSPDDRVLVTPVDLVPPRLETLRALVAALDQAPVVAPSYRGHHGHPVLMRRDVLDAYTCGESASLPPLNRVIAPLRYFVEVEDPAVLVDLDEPADLARAERG